MAITNTVNTCTDTLAGGDVHPAVRHDLPFDCAPAASTVSAPTRCQPVVNLPCHRRTSASRPRHRRPDDRDASYVYTDDVLSGPATVLIPGRALARRRSAPTTGMAVGANIIAQVGSGVCAHDGSRRSVNVNAPAADGHVGCSTDGPAASRIATARDLTGTNFTVHRRAVTVRGRLRHRLRRWSPATTITCQPTHAGSLSAHDVPVTTARRATAWTLTWSCSTTIY